MPPENRGPKKAALIVDSSPSMAVSIGMILQNEFAALVAHDWQEALNLADREDLAIVLIGIDHPLSIYKPFFSALRRGQPRLPFLLLLGESIAWEKGFDLPCTDWLPKAMVVQTIREKVQSLLLQGECAERPVFKVAIPGEEKIKAWLYSSRIPPEVRQRIFKISVSLLPVFIQGEEGTGRSEVAKAIHSLGPWKDQPFLRFYCRDLTVEEFVQKLSFRLKMSAEAESLRLTVFLEDVDRLIWDLQTILLDLLQSHCLGFPGLEKIRMEARIISSSTFPLARAVAGGKFRGNLAEALATCTIFLKPLRNREEEIPRLASEILEEQRQGTIFQKKFSLEALKILQQYYWPGNLGELESLILRSAALRDGELLGPENLIFSFSREETGSSTEEIRKTSFSQAGEKEPFSELIFWTLAHEIKNPLVAISTFASLLPEKYEDSEFREKFSTIVNLDIKRINGILEALLEYAQFKAPQPKPVDLRSLLENVLKQKEKILAQKSIRVTTQIQDRLPEILFDRAQLEFVLGKVSENAITQCPENAFLRISAEFSKKREGGGLQESVEMVLRVEGMSSLLWNLQKPEKPEEVDFENVSLTLALAHKVVLRNFGEMQIKQEPGSGTTICLRFPVAGLAKIP